MNDPNFPGFDEFGGDPTASTFSDPTQDPNWPYDPVLGRWVNGVWVWLTTPITLAG